MKIVHVYDGHERVFPGVGSVPYIAYNIAKYTAARGHDVTVLERRWEGLDYREEIEGIKFERIDLSIGSSIPYEEVPQNVIKSPVRFLRFILDRTEFALKTLRCLRKNNFDVIHVHLPFVAVILVTLSRKLRRKMIYGEQIGDAKKRLNAGSLEDKSLSFSFFSPDIYLMKRVKKVVMSNEKWHSEVISSGKVKSVNITVIPTGVDTRKFGSDIDMGDIKDKYGLTDKITILFASIFIPRKGVEYLVKAANIVVNDFDYKNALFLLAGNISIEKKYVEMIRELIREYKLDENVKIIGYIPQEELKKLYVASDIYVLPSLDDGTPPSLSEPLACGKPLIGTNVGGIVSMIKEGWNGFLVESANEKQLADKIKYLIDHPKERVRMGENSRKIAEDEFDWKKIAEKYLEVYEEVAK